MLRSLESSVKALRASAVNAPASQPTVLADLADAYGELPMGVAPTSEGLQFLRPDVTANDVPPEMLWPLDSLVDAGELMDWRSQPLAVDLSELRHEAEFYRREYGVDVERLFTGYRQEWNSWARRQSRTAESAELFDALDELLQSGATSSKELYLAAWRLYVPELGIDSHVVRRRVQLRSVEASTSRAVATDDPVDGGNPRSDERGLLLRVDLASSLYFDTESVSGLLDQPNTQTAIRPNLFERNDLPFGSHVRQRVLADVRPALASALRARRNDNVEWSLTMSPALLVRDAPPSTEEDPLRDVRALRSRLDQWPDIADASDLLIRGDREALSVLEARLARAMSSLGIQTPDIGSDSQLSSTGSGSLPPVTGGKFRDRMRARLGAVDPLVRFRDRRRAAADAAESAAAGVGNAAHDTVSANDTIVLDVSAAAPTAPAEPDGALALDPRQKSVAEAAPSDRLVVVAGAGQGKTEVVAARLEFLATEHEFSLSTEVLVLSFSRAAVAAVRKRLATRGLAGAEIRTFDSFASRVIIDAGLDPSGTFDRRIEQATQLLEDDETELPMLDDLGHIVLDEVQDLVGKRARLALALIERVGSEVGFTALGDPNQALYDFQLTDAERVAHTEILTEFERFDDTRVTSLARNFRARGQIPLAVVDLGHRLRTMNDGTKAREVVDAFIAELTPVDPEVWLADVYRAGRTTAVLTKTNGDALRVSQMLTALKIRHTLRRPSQEQGASAWVSELARLLPRAVTRRDEVVTALRSTSVADPDTAWSVLKEAEGVFRSPDELDISRIRRAIGGYGIPTALLADNTEDVVVSTVHRAKGLEFDRVFFLDTDWESDQDDFAIARRNYVALSRARDEVRRCSPKPAKAWMKKQDAPPGRWMEKVHGRGGQRVRAIEFRNGDVTTDIPFSTDEVESVHAAQALLASGRLTGAPVTLTLDTGWSTRDAPIYLVHEAEGAAFARTNEEFGRSVRKLFTIRNSGFPMVMNGATVMTVESVTGSPEVCAEAGLGESGIWLAPRLSGLVRPQWDSKWDGSA